MQIHKIIDNKDVPPRHPEKFVEIRKAVESVPVGKALPITFDTIAQANNFVCGSRKRLRELGFVAKRRKEMVYITRKELPNDRT